MPDDNLPPEGETSPDIVPVPEFKDDKHLEQLVQEMPQVVPDAVAAADQKEQIVKQTQSTAVDKKGRPFDPSIHAADAQGNPILTPKTGSFKKLRIPGQIKTGPSLNISQDTPGVDNRIRAAAQKYADLFIVTGISFFGEEWKPDITKGANERDMLIEANERAMLQYGYVEPPAWVDLLVVYSVYIGKRCFQPVTKSKFRIIWDNVKTFSTNIWLRVTGQKIKIVPTDK